LLLLLPLPVSAADVFAAATTNGGCALPLLLLTAAEMAARLKLRVGGLREGEEEEGGAGDEESG
jgi:hypothetical protein